VHLYYNYSDAIQLSKVLLHERHALIPPARKLIPVHLERRKKRSPHPKRLRPAASIIDAGVLSKPMVLPNK